ncbi:MAG: glycosyltransferase [Pyrinomonadaceae bacterium]|nr:glycosyltransferase [Pyrinomonadaceae bacterium]
MKLIVSELEVLRTYLSREFYYVMSDLITHFNWRQIETWKLWNGFGSIKSRLLDEFGELPETILFWEGYDFLNAYAKEIYLLPCHKVILADDLHWFVKQDRQKKAVGFALCEMVLSTCGYAWDKFYPEFAGTKRVVWVPHSASPDFMLPYNHDPENSILLSGAISHHYPLRQQMKTLQEQGSYSIDYHGHPGYYTGYDYETDEDIGRSYAEKLNRHRAGFTDSLIYKYVVAKYFEIPATGALLFADEAVTGPLKELGFIENSHYLPVSKENLEEKVQYILDERNHEELDEIRRRGQELVWERHKTVDRARQIDAACAF